MSIFLIIIGFFSTIVFGVLSLVGLIKKNGKAKRKGIYTAVSLIIFIVGVTTIHPSTTTVSTNANESQSTQTNDVTPATTTPQQDTAQATPTPTPNDVKDFNAAVSQTVNGLKINIAEVKIEKDKVSIGMNYENASGQKLSFYPDQGSVVIGDMQLEANTFLGTGHMGGDINAGVKKDGVIVFEVPEGKSIDISSVTEIKLNLGDIFNDSSYNTQEANISVPVK
jgi:hypothetical protein